MATEIILPKLGQTMEFATVVRWLVSEGDQVTKGQALLEIETDKAVLEVESFVEGTLLKIIAGITDPTGRILGLMPHPERHTHRTHHPRWTRLSADRQPDGLAIFANAVGYFKA